MAEGSGLSASAVMGSSFSKAVVIQQGGAASLLARVLECPNRLLAGQVSQRLGAAQQGGVRGSASLGQCNQQRLAGTEHRVSLQRDLYPGTRGVETGGHGLSRRGDGGGRGAEAVRRSERDCSEVERFPT